MKTNKCSSCGAYIKLEEGQKTAICTYCGTQYTEQEQEKQTTQIINNYYTTNEKVVTKQQKAYITLVTKGTGQLFS